MCITCMWPQFDTFIPPLGSRLYAYKFGRKLFLVKDEESIAVLTLKNRTYSSVPMYTVLLYVNICLENLMPFSDSEMNYYRFLFSCEI